MRERGLAEAMLFELPGRAQLVAGLIAHGPVVVSVADGIRAGPALRVALDTDIVPTHVVETSGVGDIGLYGTSDMSTACTMAAFAADVPLGDGMRLDVVVHRVAAVAQQPRGTGFLLRRIERHPP